jgi:hypothetical protein
MTRRVPLGSHDARQCPRTSSEAGSTAQTGSLPPAHSSVLTYKGDLGSTPCEKVSTGCSVEKCKA